ncbi:MAG TPA: 23S rRNA (adenine(2030)-N(6))-methyltransferase RlmJ [Rhizomicrobium sp.]|nr:23S rRNA (adenine(2030)-N(6))-methyltransferase RlmJ [Rhizomicrobium sp.]
MNYRHAFHAGNFADVVKHLALVSILNHLKRKDAGFAVIDTHAGRGLYDLSGEEAKRSAEAEGGIERLRDIAAGPDLLQRYCKLAGAFGKANYPGSPLIAASLLRDQDRLVGIEKHPHDAAALAMVLKPFPRARAVTADGYERLPALLPPPERRGLILIDPPYESPDEFSRAAEAVGAIRKRFATGIVVVWFPIKSAAVANSFCGEVLQTGVDKLLRIDIDTGAGGERMSAAGLLVVNPPFGFGDEMRGALETVVPALGSNGPAKASIDWLAGGE